jgi:hypothetical protein
MHWRDSLWPRVEQESDSSDTNKQFGSAQRRLHISRFWTIY